MNLRHTALVAAPAFAAGLLLAGAFGPAAPFTPETAHAQGVNGSAAIQADIRDELRNIGRKVDAMAGKLDGELKVKVTSMPSAD